MILSQSSSINQTAGRGWRDWVALAAVYAVLGMVLIGLNPLGAKVKTVPFTGEGDVLRQVWYAVVFFGAIAAADAFRQPRRLLVLSVTMTIALGWCWVSLTWAIAPSVAARRLILTTIIILTIFMAVRRIGYDHTVSAFRILGVITIILSYAALVITPAAIHKVAEAGDPNLIGNWRGILAHKNYAGAACVFTILLFTLDARKISLVIRVVVIAVTAYFLMRTHSKTSMGLLAIALAAGFAYKRYNPKYLPLLFPLVLLVGTFVTIYLQHNWEQIETQYLSPDAFTGRVLIWKRILAFVRDYWMTGAGFGSFWNIGTESPIFVYADGWVSGLATAHNGYIDLMAQVGVPGLALVAMSSVVLPLIALLRMRTTNPSRFALLAAMLVFCIGHNFTESSLWDRDAIVQVFLMFVVALIQLESATFTTPNVRSVIKHKRRARELEPAYVSSRTPEPDLANKAPPQ